ncbi:UvrD-helicase domain-containing protein [Motilimonas cestriensis]|uniref:DNA 3'-5' helicase n=1 Tax=Motilimonas cestriensis TaxID=2742685 RepID=A0ABS8W9Z8_9GAMM|nr:UvrD-helicase domain-containing protein [Motilimonas cestriensis]MCE2594927.1 UvrD-helicase domain-containing protein [Motilimonas cestriensis]
MNNSSVLLPPFSFDSHWYGGFFGNKITRLVFCDKGLTIQDKLIPWAQITAPLSLINGTLFDTLCIEQGDDTLYIPWLAKRAFSQVFRQGVQHWANYHRDHLINHGKAFVALIKQGYLRRHETLAAISQAQGVLAPLAQPDRDDPNQPIRHFVMLPALLDEAGNNALKLLQVLAGWDEAELAKHQQTFISQQKALYRHYFNTVESNPLTPLQQDACVINERSNLVLAGAGTGKTSTMVGRAGYLITSGQAQGEQILLLAFGRKAADEMDQRLALCLPEQIIKCSTFHSLGLAIIAQVEGEKPTLSPFVEDSAAKQAWLVEQFERLLAQDSYREQVCDYFAEHSVPWITPFDFDQAGDYLSFMQKQGIKSLKGETIVGQSDLLIANWLFQQGVEYEYQASPNTGQQALMSPARIYLPEHQITLINWLLDEHDSPPEYLDKREYLNDKQRISQQTFKLISHYCCDLQKENFFDNLSQQLTAQGVIFKPLSQQALFEHYTHVGLIDNLAEQLSQMLSIYKACWLEQSQLNVRLAGHDHQEQVRAAVNLLQPLLMAYQSYLASRNEIDFDDMIGRAINYVNDGRFVSPWQHILVDEFQDISEPRARLLKALRDLHPQGSLFCVGDDWQAIYRFTGADVNLTTRFANYFGDSAITSLDKTFRFNNSIAQVSSDFVCQNPAQIKKQLVTHALVNEPAISLRSASPSALHDVLEQIQQQTQHKANTSVLILARYHHLLPQAGALEQLKRSFAPLVIRAMSIHASKGMEADYVIVVGLEQGSAGFPATKSTPILLDAMLPKAEAFNDAEERRLFYVALTRAKHKVFLLANMQRPSPFVIELLEQDYEVYTEQLSTTPAAPIAMQAHHCPACGTGVLQAKQGPFGEFFGCSHFPFCSHSQKSLEMS